MFSWIEIYIGQSAEEFYHIIDIFKKENIRFKTKITDLSRKRMSRDVLFGGDPLILNTIGMNFSSLREYKIYVKKDSQHEASKIIENYKINKSR